MNQQVKRIIIEIIVGIVFSAVLSAILIFIGYANMHMSSADSGAVSVFGLTLYRITRAGGQLNGSSSGTNMMFFGVIISVLLVIVGETFFSMKGKKNK